MKKRSLEDKEQNNMMNTPLNPDMTMNRIRGDSVDQLDQQEEGNEFLAARELQQQENL
ncbi:hypothetical protein ABFG93_08165 [Pseudalkalibacillus hwajinpoensis]|uniref:hypothetical protein n=1 Tax=Guptibacillus hwajinpoensis TaxID=208199 RepID=UPI00325C192D